jgi:hypothetical protein
LPKRLEARLVSDDFVDLVLQVQPLVCLASGTRSLSFQGLRYHALRNSLGGAGALAGAYRLSLQVKPKWVADFPEIADAEDRAIRIRDACETVSRRIDVPGIEPWEEPPA